MITGFLLALNVLLVFVAAAFIPFVYDFIGSAAEHLLKMNRHSGDRETIDFVSGCVTFGIYIFCIIINITIWFV